MADPKTKQSKAKQSQKSQQTSKLKNVLHQIFVHNIDYKLLAIGTALVCWFLTVWLNS